MRSELSSTLDPSSIFQKFLALSYLDQTCTHSAPARLISLNENDDENNVLAALCAVKQTTRIPIIIARLMKRIYAHTASRIGCVEYHGYCLIETEYKV